MLYSPKERTITEVAAGATTEPRVKELASLKGRTTPEGQPIERVVLVFMRMSHAEEALAWCKQYGVGCRAFTDEGVEQELFAGPRQQTVAEGRVEGTLLPILREAKWPHLDTAVHRRLIPGPHEMGPWLTFGLDEGERVARIGPNHLHGRTLEELEKKALENLAARNMQPKEIAAKMVAVQDEYAAEAILLPELMRKVQKMVGTDMMLVSIPNEHLLVATLGEDPEITTGTIVLARKHFDETTKRRISPLPLVVQDGQIIGFVTGSTEKEAPKDDKPWWKFW